jgi:predicted site-specific integrase-resolvase
MDDLVRQINYVQSRNPEYTTYRTLSDIGSGINFTRKGLQTILDTCLQGTIGEVVVAHRDRLSRFGFDLIKCFIIKAGGKLTVLDDDGNKSTEQELAEDLLSIIHIYSCKQMGKRSYKTKKSKNSIEAKSNTEENIERMD